MPVPTIPGVPPEVWTQVLQILQQMGTDIATITEQGITTFEGLKQWLITQGYELVEISEVVGYTICKTTAVDPTETNAVATRVVTDIATVSGTGTAVSTVTSGGNRVLGLVAKTVAVGAALSLLVSTIGAGLVTDEIKEDLITSANPYTIDGENVPVLIDENGKTHFLEEMIEAIRAKAIELGVFSSGGTTPPSTIPGTYNYVVNRGYSTYSGTFTKSQYDSSVNALKTFKPVRNSPTDNLTIIYNGISKPLDDVLGIAYSYSNGQYAQVRYYLLVDEIQEYPAGTTISYEIRSNGEAYSSGGFTVYEYTFTTDGVSKSIKVPSPLFSQQTDYATMVSRYGNIFEPLTDARYVETALTYALLYGDKMAPVEGITPAQDLISAGVADTTIPLTQVLPKLAEGQMSIASPTENDLTHKSNWYPVSINSEDVFTDGATAEETSTAADGAVSEDVQPSILEGIQELIKQLIPDGYPEIPVSDSGDTPPENPPLTPGSGTDGSNGLWAIYNPSLAQVQAFGAWLWSDSLADQFKRIFNSPIDGVIGFHMLYCTPVKGETKTIKCGFLDSGVSSGTVANQYAEIDCGTVNIGEFYNNTLDYDYTRISVYLPFIGIVPLDTNIVMGSSINITYRIDVLTGTCLAQIKVIKENSDAVMYAFEGNCAVQIPLTATTYTGMIGALMSGVSAGMGVMTGNIAQAVSSGVNALANMYSGKSGVKQSGTMGANAGALGIRIPYIIITHPIEYMPYQFNKLEGLPSNITAKLSTLTGFTRVRSVHLENIGNATQEEINIIEEMLKEGVIL